VMPRSHFQQRIIVAETERPAFGFGKILFSYSKTVSEYRNQPYYIAVRLAQCLNGIEAALARRDEVFDDHHTLTTDHFPFNLILPSVIFRTGADIAKRKTQILRHQCTLRDTGSSNTRNHFHRPEFFLYQLGKFLANVRTDGGMR